MSGNGFAEYALDDLSYNVLTLLGEPKTFARLSAELKPCFAGDTPPETVGQCLGRTLGGLLSQGMVTACGCHPPKFYTTQSNRIFRLHNHAERYRILFKTGRKTGLCN